MTIVLGAVGAGIGALTAGPGGAAAGAQMGWAIGTTIGSYFDMQASIPKIEVGKLNDLRFSGSSYGATIPMVWGKMRVGGNVLWAAEDANGDHLVQHRRTKSVGSGKSKTKQTEYWYSATFMVGACVGTLHCPDGSLIHRNPVIKKVKFNDLVVYVAGAAENVVTPSFLPGTETQAPDATVVSALGLPSAQCPAWRGINGAVFGDVSLEDVGNQLPSVVMDIETDPVTVADVYSDMVRLAGLDPADIDVSAATDPVDGWMVANIGPVEQMVEPLLFAYGYDQVEVDGKLKLVKRGGSVTFALTAADLGYKTGHKGGERYKRRVRTYTEMPGRVEVKYYDVNGDFQQALEGEWRQSADQSRILTFDLPAALEPDFAREVSARELDRAWYEDQTFEVSVPHQFCTVAPGDVGTIATAAGTQRIRVLQMSASLGGEVRMVLVPDDPNTAQNTTGTGGGSGTGNDNETIVPTAFIGWSGRELVEAHEAYPGFYVAASGDVGWRGCTVFYSLDNGVTWITGPDITGRSVFGVALSALPDA